MVFTIYGHGGHLEFQIMTHFPQLYPTHSRLVYDPTETILAILYSEVPHMLPAKYQPNGPNGSGEEVV